MTSNGTNGAGGQGDGGDGRPARSADAPQAVVRRRSSRRRSSSGARRRRSTEHSVRLDAPSRRSQLLAPRGADALRGRRPRRPTSPTERAAIWVISVVGGVVAATAGCEPTGTALVDPVLCALAAGLVVLAGSRAQRWTWLVLAGVAAVVAESAGWQLVALAGAGVAFASTLLPRARWIGALAVALSIQGLFRQDLDAFLGASLLVGLAACLPVLGSAWEVAPRRARRLGRWVAAGAAAVVVVGSLLALAAVMAARSDLEDAASDAQEGLDALADGRPGEAQIALSAAAERFASGGDLAGSWWSAPAELVPLVAQQRAAVVELAAAGEAVAREGAATAGTADPQELRYVDGGIDLDLVRATQAPLASSVEALEEAEARLEAARSPWLLSPVVDRIDAFEADVVSTLPAARLAAEAVEQAPAMLGGDGLRRYLVLFTTPAESRGLGGFVGNWGLLEAVDGRVELVESGRIAELNEIPGRDERTVTGPDDYVARYGRFRPGYWLQDTTLSPDFPSVAQVWQELWPQLVDGAGGAVGDPIDPGRLDGVIAVDPYGLAALLELTGPIRVDGWDEPLDSSNAAQVLLEDQYLELDDRQERADLLDEASRVAFDELTTGTLPSPRLISEALAPMAETGRIRAWSFHPDEQDLLRRLGLDGTFPKRGQQHGDTGTGDGQTGDGQTGDVQAGGSDLLALVTSNSAQNKIDVFLERDIDYQVTYDPATGEVRSTATVVLDNGAPAEGLPEAVIGNNDQGLPLGTNRVWLSLYTPLGLDEARLDGRRVGVEFGREFGLDQGPGYSVYGGFFTLPPGGSATLEFDLSGTIAPGGYGLWLHHQPLVNPDSVHVEVTATPGWRFTPSNRVGVSDDGSTATLDVVALDRSQWVWVGARRTG